jgi:homospermidine synthase
MADWKTHVTFDGPIVMIGFGSIGTGTLPLILRHVDFDKADMVIVDPSDANKHIADENGIRFVQESITRETYRDVLTPLLTAGGRKGFCVNLSVDVSSVAIMELCNELDCLYIDTVAEPWLGYYTDSSLTVSQRSNYALRQLVLDLRQRKPTGPTAVSCCGANPGMVSWFVKQAMVNLADDLGLDYVHPETRDGWAKLAQTLGVKGIHIAERDTQRARTPKPMEVFVNTWSVEGFISEGLQPAELGWGTHEKALPADGREHDFGSGAAIYVMRPGAGTKVRSWTPTAKAQHGWLITHNESISIADYFTVREGGKAVYRPTCHYAYHPCNDAVLSLHEMAGRQWQAQSEHVILDEKDIIDGVDELGVLLYGHEKNAYWFGSQLSIEEARELAPYQNATGLQVTSAVLSGMIWAIENPKAGIVEVDEIDYRRCLEVQRPYLGPVNGFYTDWNPLVDRGELFPEDIDAEDPWQFRNVIVR